MNIAILDDYQDTIRTLACFSSVAGHHVTIWKDHTKDVDVLAERLRDTEALALIRERTPIRGPLLERLDKLRLISQVGVYPHIDVDVCTRRGVILSASQMPGQPLMSPLLKRSFTPPSRKRRRPTGDGETGAG